MKGHHVYKSAWTPVIREELALEADDNEHGNYVVVVIIGGCMH